MYLVPKVLLYTPILVICTCHIPLGGVVSSTISCGECNVVVVVVVVVLFCWVTPWGIKGVTLINGWGTLLTRGATAADGGGGSWTADIRVVEELMVLLLSGGCFVCTEDPGGALWPEGWKKV